MGRKFVVSNDMCLSTVERLLQTCPNFMGLDAAETFNSMSFVTPMQGTSSWMDTEFRKVHDGMTLCKKYGRFAIFADGCRTRGTWPEYPYEWGAGFSNGGQYPGDLVSPDDGKYFIPAYRSTINGAHLTMSSILGMAVTGLVDNYGTWGDSFAWESAGFFDCGVGLDREPDKSYYQGYRGASWIPYMYYIKLWMMGMAQGGDFFGLESPQWNRGSGKPNDTLPAINCHFFAGWLSTR